MSNIQYIALFLSVTFMALVATGVVLKYLREKTILDIPNDRSSHSTPTPRGGGIGILITVLPALALTQHFADTPLPGFLPMIGGTIGLALLSWLDDLHNLGPSIRFLFQIIAVSVCLYFLPNPEHGYLGGFLPIWFEKVILGIGWVWFINLFNFMDGINGISGVEIIGIGLGVTALSLIIPLASEYAQVGLILTAGALGFLKWNWNKAQVFMGDVGSIPLGFILAWLLILIAAEGFLIAALILPLYYLMDATITLTKRALRKEKIWQAHREHFYQKATQAGFSHRNVASKIAGLNILLILCALISIQYSPYVAILLAGLCVTVCLRHFAKANG